MMGDYITLAEIKGLSLPGWQLDGWLQSDLAMSCETRRYGQPAWPRLIWERVLGLLFCRCMPDDGENQVAAFRWRLSSRGFNPPASGETMPKGIVEIIKQRQLDAARRFGEALFYQREEANRSEPASVAAAWVSTPFRGLDFQVWLA